MTPTAAPSRIPTINPTMKPITVPSAQPTLAPSLAGSSVVPQVATGKSGQSSTDAALIFLFVVAGLIGAWCSYRLLKYCMQARNDKEKRKILRAQLDAMPPTAAVADDPALQGPHLPVPRKHRRAKPDAVPAGALSMNLPVMITQIVSLSAHMLTLLLLASMRIDLRHL